jgi:hypothetical protein
MHAHQRDFFAVGSGVWSVCHVFTGLFWNPVTNIIPHKNICVYGSSKVEGFISRTGTSVPTLRIENSHVVPYISMSGEFFTVPFTVQYGNPFAN